MKTTLTAPWNSCPREDLAFSLYASFFSSREELIDAAIEYLEENPEEEDEIEELFGLTEEEYEEVLESV